MRDNGRPVLLASTMTPNLLMLTAGTRPVVACPECGTWRVPRRGMIPAHRAADEHSRCPGSGQRITIDLTPVQWMETLRVAVREAARRRGMTVRCGGKPPVPQPLLRQPLPTS